jgi:hypothetical protein
MAYETCGDDEDDADWSGEDWSDDDDDDDDSPEDDESVACPECGATISGYLDKCTQCGYWVTDADRRALRPGEMRPLWARAMAAVLIVAFLLCLLLAGMTIF